MAEYVVAEDVVAENAVVVVVVGVSSGWDFSSSLEGTRLKKAI